MTESIIWQRPHFGKSGESDKWKNPHFGKSVDSVKWQRPHVEHGKLKIEHGTQVIQSDIEGDKP